MSESQECYDGEHQACAGCDGCWCHKSTEAKQREQCENPAHQTRCLSCGRRREGHGPLGECLPAPEIHASTMRLTRLDPEGQPMGDPVVVEAAATLGFDTQFADDVFPETEGWVQDPVFPDISTLTVDITFQEVDPALLALLTGTGDFSPGTMHALDVVVPVKRTFWQWLCRKPRRWRRYYLPNVEIGEVDRDD